MDMVKLMKKFLPVAILIIMLIVVLSSVFSEGPEINAQPQPIKSGSSGSYTSYVFYIGLEDAYGCRKQMPLKYKGVQIGTVKDIFLGSKYKILQKYGLDDYVFFKVYITPGYEYLISIYSEFKMSNRYNMWQKLKRIVVKDEQNEKVHLKLTRRSEKGEPHLKAYHILYEDNDILPDNIKRTLNKWIKKR